ncbi:hypothetical protein L226DRAFT_474467, partial [Lentinus tigrinus ALCF2SS1-7]|uniref:uncharacterized protein n=1 Tax=Lentinus tigrinus ALCF2SS1-7 TaxID=1328758 RepID=UPI0011660DD7
LGREHKDSPFLKRTIPDPALVRGFDPNEGPCCTAKKFCIDILGTPASTWNTSATKVFVQDFLTVPQHACRNRKKVHAMFRSHIKTLQRHFKKVGMAKTKGKPTEGDAGDRYQRKYTVRRLIMRATEWLANLSIMQLFQRRYAIVTRYRILRPHIKILQRLGVNGMSSDEEEEGAPFVRYRVLIKPWRSEAVTKFLRALDALHRRYRKTGGSGSKRGSPPRLRCLSTEESTSKEVPRLPINAYNERWYSEQKGLKRDDIAARPTPYNFDLDVAVIQYVLRSIAQACPTTKTDLPAAAGRLLVMVK